MDRWTPDAVRACGDPARFRWNCVCTIRNDMDFDNPAPRVRLLPRIHTVPLPKVWASQPPEVDVLLCSVRALVACLSIQPSARPVLSWVDSIEQLC